MPKLSCSKLARINVILFALIFLINLLFIINSSGEFSNRQVTPANVGGKTGTSRPFTVGVGCLKVIPDPAVLCLGESQHFIAYTRDKQGNAVQAADTTLTWSCSRTIGSINSGGIFTPTHAGVGTVTATRPSDKTSNSISVTVVEITSITPTYSEIGLANSIQFSAVTNPPDYGDMVFWSVSPEGDQGPGGTFTVTFTWPGIHTVTAGCGTSTKRATIVAVEVTSVSVNSNNGTMPINTNAVFTVTTNPTGYPSPVNWSGGGTPATQSGGTTFTTAYSTPGIKTVTATAGISSESKSITVE